jgi:uncharacterized protein
VAQIKKRSGDKRVYDLRVTCVGSDPAPWRLVAASADSTLPELHRTIQGAFGAQYVSEYCIVIRRTRYAGGKGSRSLLRRVVDVGDVFECHDVAGDRRYAAEVVRGYEVPSRRHHPKVLDGEGTPAKSRLGDFDPKVATWCAQDACRGYYPTAESFDRFNAPMTERAGGTPSQAQIDALETLLDGCDGEFDSASAVHGFFTAVVSGPMVMPSEWLTVVLGDGQCEWPNLDEAKAALGITMAMYNSVAQALHTSRDDFAVLIERIGDGDDAADFANEWCRGYVRGVALRPKEWQHVLASPGVRTPMHVIVAMGSRDKDDPLAQVLANDPKLYAQVLDALAPAAVSIYENWRRHDIQGTSRETARRTESKTSRSAASLRARQGSGTKRRQ